MKCTLSSLNVADLFASYSSFQRGFLLKVNKLTDISFSLDTSILMRGRLEMFILVFMEFIEMLNILIQRKWNGEHFLWSLLFNSASCCTFSRYNLNYVKNVRLPIFLTLWHVFKEVFTVKCRKQICYVSCVAFLYYYMKNQPLAYFIVLGRTVYSENFNALTFADIISPVSNENGC